MQAYVFARVLSGFYLPGETLREWVNFWCLIFTALAGAVGIGYFTLAFAATNLAFVRPVPASSPNFPLFTHGLTPTQPRT